MKYIFLVGAPGSKWSSVAKNIYYSPDIDRSDFSEARTYYHDAPGTMQLMHTGAYFDPGMEFGQFFDHLSEVSPLSAEAEFDRPFSTPGAIRIIKSHVFANNIDYIKATWPDCPIVLVHRSDDACLGWWVKCGHFDITYPDYAEYYKDLKTMATIIQGQNANILAATKKYAGLEPANNQMLCTVLGLKLPPAEYFQDYRSAAINLTII
jgi:hypothetical protein|tara:strand:- start:4901 stop:5524 length:624 start_codon:yes stop_codon:yes gene_type:complete